MDQSSETEGHVHATGKTAGVVARVRAMVQDGTLAAGEALPSTRALAAELGVARGTVVAAYEQLDGEGWIRTRHGAVARVAEGVPGVPVTGDRAGTVGGPARDGAVDPHAHAHSPAHPHSPRTRTPPPCSTADRASPP